MTLKEEILKNSGMDLNEGLVYFKTSSNLKRKHEKIKRKLEDVSNNLSNTEKKIINKVLEKLSGIIEDFEEVERLYSEDKEKNKSQAKSIYKDLRKKNNDLIRYVDSYQVKKAFKSLGAVLLLSAIVAIPFAGIIITSMVFFKTLTIASSSAIMAKQQGIISALKVSTILNIVSAMDRADKDAKKIIELIRDLKELEEKGLKRKKDLKKYHSLEKKASKIKNRVVYNS